MSADEHLSQPQFYHGSGKRYRPGDMVDPAQPHKSVHPQSEPDKVYFSDSHWNARNWANVASPSGRGRVYQVEPTGGYEHDPHYHKGEGDEEHGMYDLSQSPMRRVNVWQTGQPLRIVREIPGQD